jgi:hypothetical protein
MQVQVIVKSSMKLDSTKEKALEVAIMPNSTVSDVKERVSSLTGISSFPKKSLLLDGKMLADSENVRTTGVVAGDVLELVFEPCEQTFVKQLSDMMGENAVSLQELKLMYVHRYGSTVEEVLHRLGLVNQKLQAFLQDQKCFYLDGDLVKLSRGIDAKPVERGVIEVKVSVEWSDRNQPSFVSFVDEDDLDIVPLRLAGTMKVASAKKIIAAAELVPFPDQALLLRGKPLSDELSLSEAGVKDGDSLVLAVHASEATLVSQFEHLLVERTALSSNDLSLLYCQRFGSSVGQALRSLGLHGSVNRFLERHENFAVSGGCVMSSTRPDFQHPIMCA